MDKLHLVTGYKGEEHIQSADQGSFNASFFGGGEFVMEAGNQFEASIMDNNTVRILDGDALMKGRHLRIEPNTYEDVTITTGTAGMNRNDLIVFQYVKDSASGVEDSKIVVIKGTETEGTATDPAYTNGDILGGATFNQMPMYRVKVEGVVLTGIEPLFTVIPTYKKLAEMYAQQFQEACDTYIGLLNILDTMEEVSANTQEGQLAGALALKELDASKVSKGSSAKLSSVELGGSAFSAIHQIDDNPVFRYKGGDGSTKNVHLRTILSDIANRLSLSGGTLTGRLNTQNIEPVTANTHILGNSSNPFASAFLSSGLYIRKNDKNYANMVLSAEGTTSTTGLAELVLGNSSTAGADGNASGSIRLYNGNGKYSRISPRAITADTTYNLPFTGGNIPTASLSGTTLTINV